MTTQRIAVIGLGSMGFGMAQSLKRAGFHVTGCDVSQSAVARLVAEGGAGAATPAEAAKQADIVVSVVVNAAQTEVILFGTGGVAETLAKGGVFISSATMDPDAARALAARLEATGRHYLDAPISGGAVRAAEGALTILASGSPAAFAKARGGRRWPPRSTSSATKPARARLSRWSTSCWPGFISRLRARPWPSRPGRGSICARSMR
jgi:3-hydroxyisobutyrate dehydrogenase